MAAVQVVHPPGYPAECAYAAPVVLGEWLGLEYTLAEGAVDAWELHCNGATVSVPDVVVRTSETDRPTLVTGRQRRLLQAAFGETT
jgi:hypothetical protein